MSPLTIVRRSVSFYWRTHLGVILGTAIAAMVLVGSLLVGDSVKATLLGQAAARVGKVLAALTAGDRFFRADLARESDASAAPVLFLRGSVARTDGVARVNSAQVLGVEDQFWKMAPESASMLAGENVALNTRAAQALGVKAGDAIVLRVEKPGAFSRDAPLSGEEGEVIAIRAEVARVVSDAEFGRFSLAASQVAPPSIFVPLAYLQQRLQFEGRANLILSPNPAPALEQAVKERWTLADAGLEIRELPGQTGFEVRSARVFLEASEVAASPKGVEGLTYLVNEIRAGDRMVPYSMVSAVDAPSSGFLPAELDDDEIVLSQWAADDLGVKLNDRVSLKYFVMGERRQLEEKTREFEIIQILPMSESALNTSWMPDFPGLSDQANCRDWKPGFALDNTKIRDQDEAYWKQYRGTPKAFVNLMVGQEMWGNRWGKLTTIRYTQGQTREEIATHLRQKLTPEQIGFQVLPLRDQATAATKAPVDFGQLFVSFSFFLIVAAAALTGLLFVFMLEQRNAEAGTLLALGLSPKLVRRMLLGEGIALALIGSILGTLGALAYTRGVLRALVSVWRGAVGSVEFTFSANPASVAGGAIGSILVAFLAMWLASRKQLRASANALLSGESAAPASTTAPKRGPWRIAWILALLTVTAATFVLPKSPQLFFGVGALLLLGGLAGSLDFLRSRAAGTTFASASDLAQRNTARRRGRSLATIGVLASGVFMVVAVDSFRKRPETETSRRDTGTGGFALVGESALPIYDDLNSPQGHEAYGLDEGLMTVVRVIPLRVREGDDASCLNLNRALQPQILGLKPADLLLPASFRFTAKDANWSLLEGSADGAIPAIVDGNTLQWAMQKKLGDTLTYRDERGQPFQIRFVAALVGSMLQGRVVIAEKHFIEKFPGAGGYRFFLIDAPAAETKRVAEELSVGLQDRGLALATAAQRLEEFNTVENTYLSIFQALGGLGLLLGTAGLAVVVSRNVLERRREFGLLEAVGFRPGQLRQLVFAEHRWLMIFGIAIGTLSALVAVFPQLLDQTRGFPWREVAGLVAVLSLGCVFWIWLATRLALRGSQLPALRNE